MAISISYEFFSEECDRLYSDKCSSPVYGDIEFCNKKKKNNNNNNKEYELFDGANTGEEGFEMSSDAHSFLESLKEENREFLCDGYCRKRIVSSGVFGGDLVKEKIFRDFSLRRCEREKLKKMIPFEEVMITNPDQLKIYFAKMYLEPFCDGISQKYFTTNGNDNTGLYGESSYVYPYKKEGIINPCAAFLRDNVDEHDLFNVKCYEISGWHWWVGGLGN